MTEATIDFRQLAREHAKVGFAYLIERDGELDYADSDDLEMLDYCGCILSQRNGGYWKGLQELGLTDSQAFELGFGGGLTSMGPGSMDEYQKSMYFNELQLAWVDLLEGDYGE